LLRTFLNGYFSSHLFITNTSTYPFEISAMIEVYDISITWTGLGQ